MRVSWYLIKCSRGNKSTCHLKSHFLLNKPPIKGNWMARCSIVKIPDSEGGRVWSVWSVTKCANLPATTLAQLTWYHVTHGMGWPTGTKIWKGFQPTLFSPWGLKTNYMVIWSSQFTAQGWCPWLSSFVSNNVKIATWLQALLTDTLLDGVCRFCTSVSCSQWTKAGLTKLFMDDFGQCMGELVWSSTEDITSIIFWLRKKTACHGLETGGNVGITRLLSCLQGFSDLTPLSMCGLARFCDCKNVTWI